MEQFDWQFLLVCTYAGISSSVKSLKPERRLATPAGLVHGDWLHPRDVVYLQQ